MSPRPLDALAVDLNSRLLSQAVNQNEIRMVDPRLDLKANLLVLFRRVLNPARCVQDKPVVSKGVQIVDWDLAIESRGTSLNGRRIDCGPVALLLAQHERV